MHKSIEEAIQKPFGTQFTDKMAVMHYADGQWSDYEIMPFQSLGLSPAAHVLHYSSSCFEGHKVHRWPDGSIHFFRLDAHLQRFANSADELCLPFPGKETCEQMIRELVRASKDFVPDPPGALYIRPTLIGTEPSIGAAAVPPTELTLFVVLAPVGDYFSGGLRPLRIALQDDRWRTAPSLGKAKTGANYAAALKAISTARENFKVDQVLFAPENDVQETGAANFILINDRRIMTKALDDSFLHGITRDSMLKIAADMGYEVEERPRISVNQVLDWIRDGEAALSGTAAVLAPVGSIIYRGEEHKVGNGNMGEHTMKLRDRLIAIQQGKLPDTHGWLSSAD